MRPLRTFAVTGASLAFVLAVLGSWVRINDAGLTCPDWPLCRGRLVPELHGGVILEWSHRAVALLDSVLILAVLALGWRERHRIAGLGRALAALAAILIAQVLLGGATVLLGNSPLSVALHWGMGMALLGTLSIVAVLSVAAPETFSATRSAAAPALWTAAAVGLGTMCIGAYVSSSYAGLACPEFPLCGAGPGTAQSLQMLHRAAAGLFALVALFAAWRAWADGSARVRGFATLGLALVGVQIVLGALNVVWQLPMPLREAHAANAAAVFVAFAIAATLATFEPGRALARSPSRRRALAR